MTIKYNHTTALEWFDVDNVIYAKYAPPNKPAMLKATYVCGSHSFDELWLLEHPGGIRHVAIKKWKQAYGDVIEVPATVDEALLLSVVLKVPKRVQVLFKKRIVKSVGVLLPVFPEIVAKEYQTN